MNKKNSNIPKVHRKVKKREMLFEYVLIGILVITFIYIVIYIFQFFPAITDGINIASVAAAVIALYALVWQLHSAIKANKVIVTLNLDASVEGEYVTISCSVTNSGTKSIYPYLTNLYVSEGVECVENGITRYIFEPITEHQIDRSTGECFDCKVATYCKNEIIDDLTGEITFPPCNAKSPFRDKLRYAINLRQLSYFSLVHIMPKETFQEEIVLKIATPGIYRAFVIYTGKEWDDCICASTIFKLNENGK